MENDQSYFSKQESRALIDWRSTNLNHIFTELCAFYGINAGLDEIWKEGSSVQWLNGYPISREIIADRLEFHGCKNSISQ